MGYPLLRHRTYVKTALILLISMYDKYNSMHTSPIIADSANALIIGTLCDLINAYSQIINEIDAARE